MDIPFHNIPQNQLLPLFFAEVDSSHANTSPANTRALIFAPMLAAGIGTANVPRICAGTDDAKSLCGLGSIGAHMVFTYRKNDPTGELWIVPIADPGGGTAATGSISFAGTASAAGVLNLYIARQLVQVVVTSGLTAAQLATATAAAIAAKTGLVVTAAVNGGTPTKVDITSRHLGLLGNFVDLRLNYLGSAQGEVTPAGITPTIVAMAGGLLAASLTTALANLGDYPFEVVISPFNDTATKTAIATWLGDTAGRWNWAQGLYGHQITAYQDTYANLVTAGLANNDQHASIPGWYDSPTPPWKVAAAVGAQAAISVAADPGMPIRSVVLQDVSPPPMQSRFSPAQRNSLALDGVSSLKVDSRTGAVILEKLVTTYLTNVFGEPDNSYRDAETLFNLAYCLRKLQGVVTSVLSRAKLAQDNARLAPGPGVVTPSTIRALIIAAYQELCDTGNAQQPDVFAAGLVVQINSQNPNRVDVLWPAVLIERLDIFAVLAQFRLS